MNTHDDVCISDVSVISGRRPDGRSNSFVHGRRNNGILYIWEGTARFDICDSNHRIMAKTGDVVYIPKNSRYKMQYTTNTTFVLVNFEMFDKKGTDIRLKDTICVIDKDNEVRRIARIMTNLELCTGARDTGAGFRKKELVYKLLGVIYESASVPESVHNEYSKIFPGVKMLEQNYLESIPVSQYAEACNMSVSLFRSLFGRQYGMTPIQYRNRLRINRAIEILSEGSCTVSEAAFACGFENIGYFCRYYKKITGKTPGESKDDVI